MMVLNNFLEDNILSVTHFLSEVVVSILQNVTFSL
jgi:hypothetical protein